MTNLGQLSDSPASARTTPSDAPVCPVVDTHSGHQSRHRRAWRHPARLRSRPESSNNRHHHTPVHHNFGECSTEIKSSRHPTTLSRRSTAQAASNIRNTTVGLVLQPLALPFSCLQAIQQDAELRNFAAYSVHDAAIPATRVDSVSENRLKGAQGNQHGPVLSTTRPA